MKNNKKNLYHRFYGIKEFVLSHKTIVFLSSILILVLSLILVFSCEKEAAPKYSNSTQIDFDNYTNELFVEQMCSDTLSLHFFMQHPENLVSDNIPQTLGSYSYDSMVNSQNFYIQEIENLKTYDYSKLNSSQQLLYDILLNNYQNQLDFADLCLCSQVLSPTTGVQVQLPILFSEYSFTCTQDIDNYLTLLAQVENYFDQICEFQKIKADKNCFISDFCCDGIITQCKDFIKDQSMNTNLLKTSFDEKINAADFLTKEQRQTLSDKNISILTTSVLPAYENIIQVLTQLKENGYCKNSNGLYYLENGADYYAFLVKNYTGSNKAVLELKADIQSRLVSDMKTIYSIFTINPELEEQFSETPKETPSPEQILSSLSKSAQKDFPSIEKIKYEIKSVDKSLENSASPAFFLPPPMDAPDNNVIYINQSKATQNQDLFATLAHEGIPGHMYQNAFFANTNPLPLRYIIDYGGYTEGWATYVEFLSYSYQTSNKQLAQALSCSASYSLALYSLCDIGINYEGWTLEQTKEFLKNYNLKNEKVVENIFHAVIEEPANYLQYYIGYLEILSLREKWQQKMGKSFDLKKFHTAFLSIGPADFETVEKWMPFYYK